VQAKPVHFKVLPAAKRLAPLARRRGAARWLIAGVYHKECGE